MARNLPTGQKTQVQILSEMVEWFISFHCVGIKFVFNPLFTGRHAPEYNFEYWLNGRRITERALAQLVLTELSRRNYAFNLAKVASAITDRAWQAYIASQEYPDELANHPLMKRPIGRPRRDTLRAKEPAAIVNTDTVDGQKTE